MTRSTGIFSSQWFGSSAVGLAFITSMCSVQRFPGGHSLCLAFGSFFYPHPPTPSVIVPMLISVTGAWFRLVWGLMLEGERLPAMGA